MEKGASIAETLADVLAGKSVDLTTVIRKQRAKPGARPEVRLRVFLDHVERCRRTIDAGDDSYGRCVVCGDDLGLVVLGEMPWADTCSACGITSY